MKTAIRRTGIRLNSEERREAIIRAVRRVFAEKGFHGTTTRELAKAAGVSEALLFKHFPDKQSLYAAMQVSCCKSIAAKKERLKSLEPSASSLVLLVHVLVSHMVLGRSSVSTLSDEESLHRLLMIRSLMEDGEFTRQFLQEHSMSWVRKVEDCLKAAIAAGEAVDGPVPPNLRGWFAHHLSFMVCTGLRPPKPIVDYGVTREKLVEQLVWFILRGMGLKEEAIERHYNPQALALLDS
jgi:AcrR family transcriptional regulator